VCGFRLLSIMRISVEFRCKFTFHMRISPFRKFSCRCISFGKCHLTWICCTCICICILSTLDRELLPLHKYHLIWVYAEFNSLREYHFIGILALDLCIFPVFFFNYGFLTLVCGSHLHKDTDETQAITCNPVALNRVLVNSGNRKYNINVIDLLVVLSINDIKLALQFYLHRLN